MRALLPAAALVLAGMIAAGCTSPPVPASVDVASSARGGAGVLGGTSAAPAAAPAKDAVVDAMGARRVEGKVASASAARGDVDGVVPGASVDPGESAAARPRRIISLDYCADQFVLALADREAILRLSPDATDDYSYLRAQARGLPTVRPRAEDVLVLQPDVVVRSYGGGPNVRRFLESAGVRVVQIGWASGIDAVRRNLRDVAGELGAARRGRALLEDMDRRLAAIAARRGDAPRRKVLYMTPAGVTAGPGTLVHELLEAAGLANFEQRPGWHSIPLERLAYERPDLVAPAFFEVRTNHLDHWTASRHPVARRQMRSLPGVPLQGAWVACGGWFLVDAVEALADGARAPGQVAARTGGR